MAMSNRELRAAVVKLRETEALEQQPELAFLLRQAGAIIAGRPSMMSRKALEKRLAELSEPD